MNLHPLTQPLYQVIRDAVRDPHTRRTFPAYVQIDGVEWGPVTIIRYDPGCANCLIFETEDGKISNPFNFTNILVDPSTHDELTRLAAAKEASRLLSQVLNRPDHTNRTHGGKFADPYHRCQER